MPSVPAGARSEPRKEYILMDDQEHPQSDAAPELAELRTRLAAVEHQASMTSDRAAAHLAYLQSVTSALIATLTPDQVATIAIERAIPAVGAYGGGLVLINDDLSLHIAHASGYAPEVVARWRHSTLDDPVPAAVAAREQAPV